MDYIQKKIDELGNLALLNIGNPTHEAQLWDWYKANNLVPRTFGTSKDFHGFISEQLQDVEPENRKQALREIVNTNWPNYAGPPLETYGNNQVRWNKREYAETVPIFVRRIAMLNGFDPDEWEAENAKFWKELNQNQNVRRAAAKERGGMVVEFHRGHVASAGGHTPEDPHGPTSPRNVLDEPGKGVTGNMAHQNIHRLHLERMPDFITRSSSGNLHYKTYMAETSTPESWLQDLFEWDLAKQGLSNISTLNAAAVRRIEVGATTVGQEMYLARNPLYRADRDLAIEANNGRPLERSFSHGGEVLVEDSQGRINTLTSQNLPQSELDKYRSLVETAANGIARYVGRGLVRGVTRATTDLLKQQLDPEDQQALDVLVSPGIPAPVKPAIMAVIPQATARDEENFYDPKAHPYPKPRQIMSNE